jgi:NAD+ kinase
MRGPWELDDETPVVGVVTEHDGATHTAAPTAESVSTITDALDSVDVSTVRGAPTELTAADPTFCLTVGEPSLRELAAVRPSMPILPVGADSGVHAVAPTDTATAVEAVLAGRSMQCSHRLLAVVVDGESVGIVLRDLSAITTEPAQITELAVSQARPAADGLDTEDGDWLDREIVQVRADGLVIATPAGSHGYAAAADGPLLQPGTGLAIVPIAPFVTDRHNQVTTNGPLSLSVRRDEGPVTLRLDGHVRATLDLSTPVRVDPDGSIHTLVTPFSTLRSADR